MSHFLTFLFGCVHKSVLTYIYFLRTFEPIVSAHPYCARNSHATSCIERARQVVKWTIIGQMAIVVTLRGFNDLGCSVTPIFLSMGLFLYRFFTFLRKNEENLSSGSLNFLQNAPSNSVHFTSWFSCMAGLWKWWQYLKLLTPQIHLYKILIG